MEKKTFIPACALLYEVMRKTWNDDDSGDPLPLRQSFASVSAARSIAVYCPRNWCSPGTSWLNLELSGKRLELLKNTFPKVSRVAVLREAVGGAGSLRATMQAAQVLGVQLQILELRDPNELESAFAAMSRDRAGALDVLPGLMITAYRRQIVDLAAKARLPVIFPDSQFVESGGLMSYGPSLSDLYRRAAFYVDKILRGSKPAELPVEQPTKFELAINLKTAKALGLTIPFNLLAQADTVIK